MNLSVVDELRQETKLNLPLTINAAVATNANNANGNNNLDLIFT